MKTLSDFTAGTTAGTLNDFAKTMTSLEMIVRIECNKCWSNLGHARNMFEKDNYFYITSNSVTAARSIKGHLFAQWAVIMCVLLQGIRADGHLGFGGVLHKKQEIMLYLTLCKKIKREICALTLAFVGLKRVTFLVTVM